MSEYAAFLAGKRATVEPVGFEVADADLNQQLFDWQRAIVRWALHRGRAALFEDCGLGKTPQQLEWANQVARHTGRPVLILAPLAVARQTQREGEKFHIPVTVCATAADVQPGVNITNYEKLHHFTPDPFAGIVLDESSILKSFEGSTRQQITTFARAILYRLACTATPAPNDLIEITNHAEFLDIMSGKEIIALYFKQDGNTTHAWRLKKHAVTPFYQWMASWSLAMRRPSDLGYDDGAFQLPPLRMHQVTTEGRPAEGNLFVTEAQTLLERRQARRASLPDRVAACADRVNASADQWIVWCDLNAESEALTKAIPGAVQVTGSDSNEYKELAMLWFSGAQCICDQEMFRAKHVEWQEVHKKISNTCANITEKIPVNSSEHENNRTRLTQQDEIDIETTRNLGISARNYQEQGTRKRNETDDLSLTMGSQQKNTTECTNDRETDAQYAEQANHQTCCVMRERDDDFTSTTITNLVSSGDCSAQTATLGLESSKIITNCSNELQCICGHASGRRVLVSKSSICGFGMNFQNCHQMAFVGLSDSWEQLYQATRRCWRFGQHYPVDAYIITSDAEGAVVRNIERKEAQATAMFDGIIEEMNIHELNRKCERKEAEYVEDSATGKGWELKLGDSCQRIKEIPDSSIGLTVFSPPFPGMYSYTNSPRDVGNVADFKQLIEHFGYMMDDMLRITMPGRQCCIHLTQEPVFKGREGHVGMRDFRGDVIRHMQDHGWIYYGEVTIDKDPQVKASRTKEATLLFKTLSADSAGVRPALADYLLIFRKPGDNPVPIHAGSHERWNKGGGWITPEEWCEWAAPVWYRAQPDNARFPNYPSRHQETDGIRETDVLNPRAARDQEDEKHLCPLQLGVIERAIKLWSAPGDTVFSPFAGIGSEGYQALAFKRKFIGIELKPSYWRVACDNLRAAENLSGGVGQMALFGEEDE
jgi:hypothetical protein